jgi:hypothetical protein
MVLDPYECLPSVEDPGMYHFRWDQGYCMTGLASMPVMGRSVYHFVAQECIRCVRCIFVSSGWERDVCRQLTFVCTLI